MDWFFSWWDGLSALQQVFACAAIPASIILILQTILLLFGMGGHAADHGEIDDHSALMEASSPEGEADVSGEVSMDADGDADHDLSHQGAGIRLFTVRGLVAFFAVGGWLGIVLTDAGLNTALAIVLSLLSGCAALVLVALIIKWSLSMQEDGNLTLKSAIAQTGSVYITIPPERSGSGKVTLTLQEQFMELEAMTDSETPLPTGTQVQVTGVAGGSTLIVRPIVPVKKCGNENRTLE